MSPRLIANVEETKNPVLTGLSDSGPLWHSFQSGVGLCAIPWTDIMLSRISVDESNDGDNDLRKQVLSSLVGTSRVETHSSSNLGSKGFIYYKEWLRGLEPLKDVSDRCLSSPHISEVHIDQRVEDMFLFREETVRSGVNETKLVIGMYDEGEMVTGIFDIHSCDGAGMLRARPGDRGSRRRREVFDRASRDRIGTIVKAAVGDVALLTYDPRVDQRSGSFKFGSQVGIVSHKLCDSYSGFSYDFKSVKLLNSYTEEKLVTPLFKPTRNLESTAPEKFSVLENANKKFIAVVKAKSYENMEAEMDNYYFVQVFVDTNFGVEERNAVPDWQVLDLSTLMFSDLEGFPQELLEKIRTKELLLGDLGPAALFEFIFCGEMKKVRGFIQSLEQQSDEYECLYIDDVPILEGSKIDSVMTENAREIVLERLQEIGVNMRIPKKSVSEDEAWQKILGYTAEKSYLRRILYNASSSEAADLSHWVNRSVSGSDMRDFVSLLLISDPSGTGSRMSRILNDTNEDLQLAHYNFTIQEDNWDEFLLLMNLLAQVSGGQNQNFVPGSQNIKFETPKSIVSLNKRFGLRTESEERFLQTLLEHLDGWRQELNKSYLFVYITDSPEIVNDVFKSRVARSSKLNVDDKNGRAQIFKTLTANKLSSSETQSLGKLSETLSGRDIKKICDQVVIKYKTKIQDWSKDLGFTPEAINKMIKNSSEKPKNALTKEEDELRRLTFINVGEYEYSVKQFLR